MLPDHPDEVSLACETGRLAGASDVSLFFLLCASPPGDSGQRKHPLLETLAGSCYGSWVTV